MSPARPPARRRGLVLGGGGVLGAAWMVGALKALQDELGTDVREFDQFVGTSAGSVLAGLLAAGGLIAAFTIRDDALEAPDEPGGEPG